MSMLAESRSRQKWSADPRNTNWSQDKTKFGYQMLTKMGWSEGNGLGQNLTGNVDHVKVKKRDRGNNLGIGVKKSHDDDWIAHQDDFNALLASLNGKESDTPTADKIESKTNSSKFRYTKFVKSKDLSSASSKDLACIFGQRGKSSPEPTPPCEEEEPKLDDDKKEDAEVVSEELSVKTVESSLSMSEYFAQKMAALKQKTNNGNCYQSVPIYGSNGDDNDIVKEVVGNATVESVTPIEIEGKKKKKKKKKLVVVADENVLENQRTEEDTNKNENCISGKKRKKESEVVPEEGVVKKKKKKKREEEREQEVEVVQQVETVVEVTKKKKKKKKKEREQASE